MTRKNGQTKACLQCGKEFYASASNASRKYCSCSCVAEARSLPADEKKARYAKYQQEYRCSHKEQLNTHNRRYRTERGQEWRDTKRAKRRANKQTLIDLWGSSCQRCGYSEMQAALEFHHIEAQSKKDKPACLIAVGPTENVLAELDKCVLLCSNCHAGLHASEWEAKWVRREGNGWTLDG